MRYLVPISLIFLLCSPSVFGQSYVNKSRTVALLDVTNKNGETTDEEIWPATHSIKVAGLPYVRTTSVNTAITFRMIIISSRIESATFTTVEMDSLKSYVNRGGVLVATNVKNNYVFDLFGINSELLTTGNHKMYFDVNTLNTELAWLNDTMEQVISIGDTALPTVVNTRSYGLSTGTALARYEDNSVAIVRNQYGLGTAYALGFSYKNLVLRNLLDEDYNANRSYSNNFEPTTDVVFLLLRGIYQKFLPKAVWLHTSPYNSRAALTITHDVDATTAYDTMHLYADYEHSIGLSASYYITTHYVSDGQLTNFYNTNNLPKVQYLLSKGHILGSHSVGHFPDFDNETVFPVGTLGNTTSSYLPYNQGNSNPTTGGTLLGEVELSKYLLENDFGIQCRTWRSGYLCFHDKLINALDTLGYAFNTTFSANDILTNFPFFNRKERKTTGQLTRILEIPMTISDVFFNDNISISNYSQKVAIWLDVINRNAQNCAPTTLLIHPNRQFKLWAEQDFINQLPPGIFVCSLERYGDYWLKRDSVVFSSQLFNNDSLIIKIPSYLLPMDSSISFVVQDGQSLSQIRAEDENGNPISVISSNFGSNDKIVYLKPIVPVSVPQHAISTAEKIKALCYPNPNNGAFQIDIRVDRNQQARIQLYDLSGRMIYDTGEQNLLTGWNTITIDYGTLSAGTYFYQVKCAEGTAKGKVIIGQ